MRSDRQVLVAIVGGGASGTILAAQLARRGVPSVLIDGSGCAGRGVAYSTPDPVHLLNVRAESMSAWAGEPDDFTRRFEGVGGGRRDFAPRRFYGQYLREILDDAIAGAQVTLVEARAIGATRGERWRIALDDGNEMDAEALVLALGNQEPEPLPPFAECGERFIANPWGDAAREAIGEVAASGDDLLCIGTGLTMVDLALSLDAAGHRGRMIAVSRRGLVPRSHADFEPAPAACEGLPSGNLGAMSRWVRCRSAATGWRAAVDALRPHSHALWQSLDPEQQRRFLRHARPWWDVHRHRIAPEVARTIADMIADGRLEVISGRFGNVRETGSRIEVEVRRRGGGRTEVVNAAFVFNCTGPLHAAERTRDPLLRGLLDDRLISADQLGIGLAVDGRSRAAGADRLWALGGLTKGRYWEIVAVPDIREQAAAVANDIALELASEH
jgi:uncharacterized NAD(P)/FAD-binding protein YdhS